MSFYLLRDLYRGANRRPVVEPARVIYGHIDAAVAARHRLIALLLIVLAIGARTKLVAPGGIVDKVAATRELHRVAHCGRWIVVGRIFSPGRVKCRRTLLIKDAKITSGG